MAEHLRAIPELVVVHQANQLDLVIDAIRKLSNWPEAKIEWAIRDAELSCRENIAFFFVLRTENHIIGLIRATAFGNKLHIHSMHRNKSLERFSLGVSIWQAALRWLIEDKRLNRVIFAYGTPAQDNKSQNVAEVRSPIIMLKNGLQTSLILVLLFLFQSVKSALKTLIYSGSQAGIRVRSIIK